MIIVQEHRPRSYCNKKSFYLLNLRSWALLEEPPIVQLLKNFPAFYGTRRFNIVFTRALHWSLSWAMSIQTTPSRPISLRSILILSTYLRLGLPSGLFPSGFPTNILYAFLFSPIKILLDYMIILVRIEVMSHIESILERLVYHLELMLMDAASRGNIKTFLKHRILSYFIELCYTNLRFMTLDIKVV
jgi:hypothetical protein